MRDHASAKPPGGQTVLFDTTIFEQRLTLTAFSLLQPCVAYFVLEASRGQGQPCSLSKPLFYVQFITNTSGDYQCQRSLIALQPCLEHSLSDYPSADFRGLDAPPDLLNTMICKQRFILIRPFICRPLSCTRKVNANPFSLAIA